MQYRTEIDTHGKVEVPANAYYGAQTARSLDYFRIGGQTFPRRFIRALGLVKRAALQALAELGYLSPEKAKWVLQATDEVIAGELDAHFPLVVWQTGSGTHTHMNANEVIANRANELAGSPLGSKHPIHPNDDVNLGQSTNDVFPTAMHVAVVEELQTRVIPAVTEVHDRLREHAEDCAGIIKIGRTHLMDAVPMTLGQEFAAWARQAEAGRDRLVLALEGLHEVSLGGTAVGTGLNAPAGYAEAAVKHLAALTGQPFRMARNKFEGQAAHDALVFASGALRNLAVGLMKVANDLRLLGSGPRCGLGELSLPANEPGSSVMPGKVNPTQCEALTMVCTQVMGLDAAIAIGGSSGHLQMNAFKPLLVANILTSCELLGDSCRSFAEHCLVGLKPNGTVIRQHVNRSLMLATALNPHLGYEGAAQVVKKALAEDLTLREAAAELGVMDHATFDRLVDIEKMSGLANE